MLEAKYLTVRQLFTMIVLEALERGDIPTGYAVTAKRAGVNHEERMFINEQYEAIVERKYDEEGVITGFNFVLAAKHGEMARDVNDFWMVGDESTFDVVLLERTDAAANSINLVEWLESVPQYQLVGPQDDAQTTNYEQEEV